MGACDPINRILPGPDDLSGSARIYAIVLRVSDCGNLHALACQWAAVRIFGKPPH